MMTSFACGAINVMSVVIAMYGGCRRVGVRGVQILDAETSRMWTISVGGLTTLPAPPTSKGVSNRQNCSVGNPESGTRGGEVSGDSRLRTERAEQVRPPDGQ